MNKLARIVSAPVLALMLVANPGAVCANEPSVEAQDLKSLRVPGKVDAALWTRRSDFYTLQVVLDVRPAYSVSRDGALTGAKRREPTDLQIWLLRADGTLILPQRTELPDLARVTLRTNTLDATYSFPLSAGTEAVAVAMRLDDGFYINKRESFGN